MKTRIQLRGICPHCFGEWALVNGGMSQHAYTRTHGWNNGACTGHNRPHFGTPEGRKVAASQAAFVRSYAARQWESAKNVRAHNGPVLDRKGVQIENPMPWQVQSVVEHLEHDAKHADNFAADVEKKVRDWKPVAPSKVKLSAEKKERPVHLASKAWGHAAPLCTSSAMAAQKAYTKVMTNDRAKVTCARCLARLAAHDAKQAK